MCRLSLVGYGLAGSPAPLSGRGWQLARNGSKPQARVQA